MFAGVTWILPAVVLTLDASGSWGIHLCRGVVSVLVAIVVGKCAHHCERTAASGCRLRSVGRWLEGSAVLL